LTAALALSGSVGDDLGDVAVFPADVLDDLLAAAFADVHVDIGHFRAVRVHEPLEVQFVAQGVGRGEAQAVADDRRAGAASAAAGDALRTGIIHEIPDDQEVARKTLGLDDAEFVVDTLADGVGEFRVFLRRAYVDQLAEVIVGGLALG
jgi:hypothetical protein